MFPDATAPVTKLEPVQAGDTWEYEASDGQTYRFRVLIYMGLAEPGPVVVALELGDRLLLESDIAIRPSDRHSYYRHDAEQELERDISLGVKYSKRSGVPADTYRLDYWPRKE